MNLLQLLAVSCAWNRNWMDSEKAENLVLSNYILPPENLLRLIALKLFVVFKSQNGNFGPQWLNLLAEFVQQSGALCKGTLILAWNDCIFTYSPIPAWKKFEVSSLNSYRKPRTCTGTDRYLLLKDTQSSLKYFSVFVWMSAYAGSLKCCFQTEDTVFTWFQISSSTCEALYPHP